MSEHHNERNPQAPQVPRPEMLALRARHVPNGFTPQHNQLSRHMGHEHHGKNGVLTEGCLEKHCIKLFLCHKSNRWDNTKTARFAVPKTIQPRLGPFQSSSWPQKTTMPETPESGVTVLPKHQNHPKPNEIRMDFI